MTLTPPLAPNYDAVVTLLDANAALERAIALDAIWHSTTPFDPTRLQFELDAANAAVQVQALKLVQLIEAHHDWISTVVGPSLTALLPAVSTETGAQDWLRGRQDDFATEWADQLIDLIAEDHRRWSPCTALSHHVAVEAALCLVLSGIHCLVAAHEYVENAAACFSEPPPHE